MTKTQFSKRIIVFELIGFSVVILFMWLNELLDLPHNIFNSPATPINYLEGFFETLVVSLLAALVIILSHLLLQRIKHLEGILPICSFCKRIRSGGEWISIDSYIRDHSDAKLSHSVCPQCAAEHYGEFFHVVRGKP